MCARYTLTDPARVKEFFPQYFREFSETALPKVGRYNIAPTQPVVGVKNDGRDLAEDMRWGIRGRVNIRAESVAARQVVRNRCILFADGFYEWQWKQAWYYTLRSGQPFALAGTWVDEDGTSACDIITCEPNNLVARVHDRMPVILTGDAVETWLEPYEMPSAVVGELLQPFSAAKMRGRPVSKLVNDARYEGPDILDAPHQQSLL